MCNLFLADSCPLMVEGVRHAVSSFPQLQISGVCHSYDWLQSWLTTRKVDVLLLDPALGGSDYAEVCKKISQKYPKLKILLFSNDDNPELIRRLLRSGTRGILPRNVDGEELLKAVEAINRGEIYLHERVKTVILGFSLGLTPQRKSQALLTRREREILRLIVDEYTTREIAEKLYIEFCTVETHRKNLIQKLGVKNTAGLVRVAVEQQLCFS